jgi:hypothetical protein
MSNALRNSIILLVIFIFMLSGFLVVHNRLSKNALLIETENKKTSDTIAELEKQISKKDSLIAAYELQLELQSQQSKILVAQDSANLTYQYLLRVLGWMGRYLPFNFSITEGAKKAAAYNEYVISGRTNYMDVVNFAKQLEYQRAVLTIEDFTIGADAMAASDTVNFSMIFRTHFQEGGPQLETLTRKTFPGPYQGYYLFKSRIYESVPERDIDPNLVNISNAVLIGIGEGKAFLRDKQNLIHILSVGDKVAYGYLSAVDLKYGRAVFKLNLYGLEETHFLLTTPKP